MTVKHVSRGMVAILLVVAMAASAAAGPLEDGVAAYRKRDWATALRLLKPLAEQGNAAAEERLGRLYERGKAVPQNYRTALDWYQKAADQGDAEAQGHLGFIYRSGALGPPDYALALKWYRQSAEKNVAVAQVGLGFMYKGGEGVPPDDAAAANWFRKAVQKGDAMAELSLAWMYRYGKGVPKDLNEAQRLLGLAAAGTDPEYDDDEVFSKAKREREEIVEQIKTKTL